MEGLSYIEKIKRYHTSKDVSEKYNDKWVARVIPRPNYELPFYASKAAPNCNGQFISSTNYIYNTLIFPSKEAVERFIQKKQNSLFEPHQFSSQSYQL